MEKQKIFWVVLSVSVFVVIVLVVGVYLLRQKPQAVSTPPGAINPITGPGPQIFEYSPEKPQAQTGTGTEQKPGEPQTMHFYIGDGEKPPAGTPPAAGQNPPAVTPPAVSPPAVQPPIAARPPVAAQPPAAAQQPLVRKPAATPPAAAHPRVAAAVPRKPAPAVKAAVKPRQPRRAVDYWIQTGSYKSQSKADELVATLADKGLSGKVFSFDAAGGTFYRVRIGPYTNTGEADKFLSIVKQIQGLESSFVSQVGGLRNVN